MPTPVSDPNEPSKMKKLISGNTEDPRSRLPRGNDSDAQRLPASAFTPPVYGNDSLGSEPRTRRFQFLPAFWTIASMLSLTINVILIVILLLIFRMLGAIQSTANDQASGLLGGLYTNFVKMDQATIASTIPVDATIPLNISVPVQTTTQITLAQSVTIRNARVHIDTPPLRIDADADVTLPANTVLPVILNFQLPVQNNIPIHLNVPVNIPLSQTQLHEPFVGLQKVVEPWYCLVEPDATVNGLQVCPPFAAPAPAQTVIP